MACDAHVSHSHVGASLGSDIFFPTKSKRNVLVWREKEGGERQASTRTGGRGMSVGID